MAAVNKRRDRHEIVGEILSYAKRANIKTHIMYKAKLSFSQINEYLPLLINKGLLENTIVKRKRRIVTLYSTTKKGKEFLVRLESVNKLWKSEGLSSG